MYSVSVAVSFREMSCAPTESICAFIVWFFKVTIMRILLYKVVYCFFYRANNMKNTVLIVLLYRKPEKRKEKTVALLFIRHNDKIVAYEFWKNIESEKWGIT